LIQRGILTTNLHEDRRSWAHECQHRYSARKSKKLECRAVARIRRHYEVFDSINLEESKHTIILRLRYANHQGSAVTTGSIPGMHFLSSAKRPDRLLSPHSLLLNGYRYSLPGGTAPSARS